MFMATWAGSCVASMGAYLGCSAMSCFSTNVMKQSARVAYCFLFSLAMIAAWLMRDFGKPLLEKIPCTPPARIAVARLTTLATSLPSSTGPWSLPDTTCACRDRQAFHRAAQRRVLRNTSRVQDQPGKLRTPPEMPPCCLKIATAACCVSQSSLPACLPGTPLSNAPLCITAVAPHEHPYVWQVTSLEHAADSSPPAVPERHCQIVMCLSLSNQESLA